MNELAISINNVTKKYRTGFWGKSFVALDDLSLTVKQGEILGYLGPNGAGKTTTFKVLLGLMKPSCGSISFFGNPADRKYRKRIGFLPENPYFYMYLTAEESLHFFGQLKGMKRDVRKKRIPRLLKQVGLESAAKRPLKKFSRGMLQRIGIAQALVNNPDVLILDEPMSGLDPTGRKEMRDIILGCRSQGKTVIFSSHILSDVEILCDRAAVIQQGKLQGVVQVSEFLDNKVDYWEITCTSLHDPGLYSKYISHQTDNLTLLKISDEFEAKKLLFEIEQDGGRLISFGPHRTNLEDFFFQQTGK